MKAHHLDNPGQNAANGGAKRLLPWIWRSYLRTALIPLLLIELVLVAAYLLTNDTLREKNIDALREMASDRLYSSVNLRVQTISQELVGIARSTDYYRDSVRHALLHETPDQPRFAERLARSPGGAWYSKEDDGDFAVFYSALAEASRDDLRKVEQLYGADPAMKKILSSHEEVVQIYFNSFDSLNIIRPYFDVLEQYPERIDIPSYNFYYLADAKHNPSREPVWTDVYVDPAGQGWMASCIAPVYRGDFLEGVVGLDVTVKKIVQRIENLKVPWDGYALLLDRDGTIMAMPPAAEQDWGVTELTDHNYAKAIESDIFKPDAFNIVKRDDTQPWAQSVMAKHDGYQIIDFAGRQALAWSTIEQTGWKLLMVVPEANIFERVDNLGDQVRDLGYLMLLGLAIFYLFFLAYLFYRSRRMSEQLAGPLLGISEMTKAISLGHYDNQPEPVGLEEIDTTANSVAELGRNLGSELDARLRAERHLADINATLEERIKARTQELETEVEHSKELEEELRRMAEYDPLTKLPNRRLFDDRFQQAVMLANRNSLKLALLFVDLDKFKPVNDIHGHEAGDELLRQVAERLCKNVRASDTVARFGGDEFCVLLYDVASREAAETVANKLLEQIDTPFDLGEVEVTISASIGIALYPHADLDWRDMLREADAAMYRAKHAGRGQIAHMLD
ncbi:MAG: diguanylate cyclase domain-containing protein [Gammaproteobacteria bacterium]